MKERLRSRSGPENVRPTLLRKKPVHVPLVGRAAPGVISSQCQIRPVRPAEIDQALSLVISDGSGDVADLEEKLSQFKTHAEEEGYDLGRQVVAFGARGMSHACLFVLSAGGVGFVHTSMPRGLDIPSTPRLAIDTLEETCRWAFDEGCRFLQVILPTDDVARRQLCLDSGFERLTDLYYLLGRLGFCESSGVDLPPGLVWVDYDSRNEELFKRTLAATYEGSQDCPELSSIRNVDDALEAHRGPVGSEDRCWKMLVRDGQPVGVLLLSSVRSQSSMELTYMGLCPEARRSGLGRILMDEALACVRQRGRAHLVLAVDCRNDAALKLYRRAGLMTVAHRTVMIRYCRATNCAD